MARDVLIVDDEADIRELLGEILSDENYITRMAANSDTALQAIAERLPSLVVLDIWLQGSRLDGLQILEKLQHDHPDLPVVMISGHGNIEAAVQAIKFGAYDYIEKPFKTDRLLHVVQRALETSRLEQENRELRQQAGQYGEIVGRSHTIQTMRTTIEKVAPTGSRVLITGPPGSGKEVVARALHLGSGRSDWPFIVLNAANMAPDRMETELFGVEDGASGGPRLGVFEQAHGGTLLLDEVADMPLETQGRILRVLVDQKFERVGGSQRIAVDVRVISSSSRDLRLEIVAGRFREDLYHRLNVVPIAVPALDQRREDIADLVEHFMARSADALNRPPWILTEDALAALQSHDWPGNVRQLRNLVERLLILAPESDDRRITVEMLPPEISMPTPALSKNDQNSQEVMSLPLRDARELFEREYLIAQIHRFGGNVSRTAEFIGMERSALHRKLKNLGVNAREVNSAP